LQDHNSLIVDLPFYSATIIQVSVEEAAMATRRKAKGKAKGKAEEGVLPPIKGNIDGRKPRPGSGPDVRFWG
jgi:hypothetical protein